MHRFHYLKYALAVVLIFIGMKGFYSYFFGKFDPYLSLAITVGIIAAGIFYSLWKNARRQSFDQRDALTDATESPGGPMAAGKTPQLSGAARKTGVCQTGWPQCR